MGTGDDVTPWSWREHRMEGATARAPTRSAALAVVRVLQWVRLLVVAAACLTLPAELIADAGPARAHLDILVLHSYHQGLPWTDSEQEGLQIGLGEHRSHFGVFIEYLDALRFPIRSPEVEGAAAQRLAERYARIHIDYLVATDDPAYRLLLAHRDRLWSGIPILFAGVNNVASKDVAHLERVAGISERPDFFANLALIQSLHPKVDRLVVVGDETKTFASNRKALEDANVTLARPFTVAVIVRHSLRDVLAELRGLSGEFVIFLMGRPFDDADRIGSEAVVASAVRGATRHAVYSAWSFFLGHGIVGGKLVSGKEQGLALAGLLTDLSAGKTLADLPRVTDSPNRYLFDYAELDRLGLSGHPLPLGSVVINRPASVRESYPKTFAGSLAVFVFLLVLLALQRRNLRVKQALSAEIEKELVLVQALMNAAPFPMFFKDVALRYQRINDAFVAFLGKSREAVIGQTASAVAPPAQAGVYRGRDEDLLAAGGRQIYETVVVGPDQTPRDVVFHKAVVRLPGGSIEGIVGAMLDVSELRRNERELRELNEHLEQRVAARTSDLAQSNLRLQRAVDSLALAQDELVRSEKLASLGSMVAGVAHELNTPIGNALTVSTALQHKRDTLAAAFQQGALRKSSLDEFLAHGESGFDMLVRNLERAARLITNFKEVAVDQTSDRRRSFRLVDVVEECVHTFTAGAGARAPRFQVDVAESIAFEAYPGALGQIFLNLFENARVHAFADDAPGTIRVDAQALPDGNVRISVGDSGKGIAADALARIFDPFFTTRLGQGGSGLGLAIVYRLVTKKLGGRIRISSEPEQGAIFIIELPTTAPQIVDGGGGTAPRAGEAPPAAVDATGSAAGEASPLHRREEILDIRVLVESHAAAAAARHLTEAGRRRLTEVFERLDQSFSTDDAEAQLTCDLAFHMAIIDLSGDPALQNVGAAVIPLMYGHMRRTLVRLMPDPQRRETLRRQHRAIYEAIIAGDSDRASASASAHIVFVRTDSNQHDETAPS
jgi:PAS domain S-box-containing protein